MASPELTAEDVFESTDNPLLHAARIKLQTLIGLAEDQTSDVSVDKHPSLPVIQDYNQLLALARKALPELKSAFPPDIITPYDAEYQSIRAAEKSFWEVFLPSWHATPKPDDPEKARLITYRELYALCRQIERLLK
jgi:hypothetical protein